MDSFTALVSMELTKSDCVQDREGSGAVPVQPGPAHRPAQPARAQEEAGQRAGAPLRPRARLQGQGQGGQDEDRDENEMKNICIVVSLQYLDNDNVVSILRASSVTIECLQSAAAFSPPPLQWSWGSSRCHEGRISWGCH